MYAIATRKVIAVRKMPARLAFWRRIRPPRPAPATRTVVLAALPVGLVATIAGIVSYSHIVALGVRTHQGAGDAHLLPFAVDFLIVAGSVILLAGYWLGWLCVAAGVAGTLFANLEFGLPYGWLAAVVSTWPAVAFTVATFVLERWLRSRRKQSDQPAAEAAQSVQGVPRDKLDGAIAAMLATAQAGNPLSGRQLTARFALKPPDAGKVRELVLASMNGSAPPDAPE
jgi:hypothetical protein